MIKSRKDHKGRKLREGESWRKDGRYSYRYMDIRTGKRIAVYAQDLPELREKEKQIAIDTEDNIQTDFAIKKLTLNKLFERYMASRELAKTTRMDYVRMWDNRVKEEIGNMKVVQVLPSHIRTYYTNLSKAGYAFSTIRFISNLLYPMFEMAIDDDIIRKNPAKGSIRDYGKPADEKTALTTNQQGKLMTFIKNHSVYKIHYPMFTIMLGTALRCGELIGLTWNDVDMCMETIDIDHQLIYKNIGEGCRFYITKPKTKAGERTIPMTQEVLKAFKLQQEINALLEKGDDFELDGYRKFIFMAKSGRPLMPSAVNSILYGIVNAYNKQEAMIAKEENREAELLPQISAHIMRHTACTRMAECRIDIKVLQYIMGHAHIDVTMEVYNHIGDMVRVDNEIAMLNTMTLSC